jgi:hypothetical protein
MKKNGSTAPFHALVMLMLLAATSPALAQETREQELARQRAEKATALHPFVPDKLEKRIERVTKLLNTNRPLYPFVGGLFEGSGPAVGPAFRARFGDSGKFTAFTARSLDGGTGAGGVLTFPSLFSGRIRFESSGNWLETNAMHGYTTGNDSTNGRFDFAFRSTSAGIIGRFELTRQIEAGAGVDAIAIRTDTVDPTYMRTHVFAKFDSRKPGGYASAGGLYRVDALLYHQVNDGASSFRRFDAEANQFFPIFRHNWAIALRAKASTTETAAGQSVPFFLLPTLGGGQSLRGYSTGRYRDRASMLFSAEYRWTAGPFIDMALFIDAGRVAPSLSQLNFRELKRSYGIGTTLHSFDAAIFRIDVARTAQGARLLFSLSPRF